MLSVLAMRGWCSGVRDIFSEFAVFDFVPEPLRIVAGAQMVQPAPVIDAVGNLQKEGQVLGPRI
jgi:hypothetical protein